jgi:hypothetical protein
MIGLLSEFGAKRQVFALVMQSGTRSLGPHSASAPRTSPSLFNLTRKTTTPSVCLRRAARGYLMSSKSMTAGSSPLRFSLFCALASDRTSLRQFLIVQFQLGKSAIRVLLDDQIFGFVPHLSHVSNCRICSHSHFRGLSSFNFPFG